MSRRPRIRIRPGVRRRPAPRPVINNKPIEYVLNDMTTPNLIRVMDQPQPMAAPTFLIKGYQGGGFPRGTEANLAANTFVTMTNVLKYYRKFMERPMNRWAAVKTLAIIPMAGKDLNAFYNRLSLQFFHFQHPKMGQPIYLAESADVVAHELGHAIFDTYRPDTWGAASLEIMGYHEAFADLTALLSIMGYHEVVNKAIKQTQGDLRKPNVISRLAEGVGRTIFKFTGPQSGRNNDCLRNAVNNFKYIEPKKLPKEAPYNKLAAECHSFGRVFLGAFYDILVGIYEEERKDKRPFDALRQARDELAKRALVASCHAGLNARYYESVAKTMLWVDKTKCDGKYEHVLSDVFAKRDLIRPQLRIMNAPACNNDENIVKAQSTISLRLSDHVLRAQSQNNPLYDVQLEIPHEQMYLYDNEKNVMDAVLVTKEEAISAAIDTVDYLHETGSVSDDPETPFEIKDGKLVRTHFS